MIAERYYFNSLSDKEKAIYRSVPRVEGMHPSIQTGEITSAKTAMEHVWSATATDKPHLFYSDTKAISYHIGTRDILSGC